MANNRGGNREGSKTNNPNGRNQYSGFAASAREHPLTTAAAVGGAVAAGVFLWSRRSQMSDQISTLSDRMSQWRDDLMSDSNSPDQGNGSGEGFMAQPTRRARRRSQSEISNEALSLKETGKSV